MNRIDESILRGSPKTARTSGRWVFCWLSVNRIGALFERRRKALKRRVEHRAHQHRQHPALEFVSEEKSDIACAVRLRLERPAVLEVAERPLQVFDENFQIGTVERPPAGEGFAHQLERNRHIRDHDLGAVSHWRALTYF